jgi:hypothetical protein
MKTTGILLALVISFFGVGCGSTPKPIPYTLTLRSDPNINDLSVYVDVVGVKASEKDDFERYPLWKYWEQNDPMRRDALKKTFRFGPGGQKEYTVDVKDPVWNDWIKTNSVRYLVVIANIPGVQDDGNRRKVLDLDKNRWEDKSLKILVRQSNLVVESKLKGQ